MGEVYRARDTRLDRTVAIKVLPEHLADRPEQRQRLEREAKAISALNHPNICTLYDIGHQDGLDFLVMEYLQGETLADRLRKGPLSPEQALPIAIQIAAALALAHRQNVTHRDLKPANVMLTKSGAKLLDFGLAKVAQPGPGLSENTATMALTAEGTILGTFQYMSPEQLEGKEAGPRSDIFAFGAVLYEMLTGRKAFNASSQATLISEVMGKNPPPVSQFQPLATPALDRVVKRCLAKSPEERWQSVADLEAELGWIAESKPDPATPQSRTVNRERIAWAGVVFAFMLAAGWFAMRGPNAADREPVRLTVMPPEGTKFGASAMASLSPDGGKLAFVAIGADGTRHLWVRPLGSETAQELTGTDDAHNPFWSPDGKSIAFFTQQKLRKIDATGGTATDICDVLRGSGGVWSSSGDILFAPAPPSRIRRVAAAGGTPNDVTKSTTNVETHFSPEFLPGDRRFLFSIGGQKPGVYVASLDASDQKLVVGGAYGSRIAGGHLLYWKGTSLLAQKFDLAGASVSGDPIVLAQQAEFGSLSNIATPSAEAVVYQHGAGGMSRLTWIDRSGKRTGFVGDPETQMSDVAISPQGDKVAATLITPEGPRIWIYDIGRQVKTRMAIRTEMQHFPVWSPNGKQIAYLSMAGAQRFEIRVQTLGDPGEPSLLLSTDQPSAPRSWSSDSRYVVFSSRSLMLLPATPGSKPAPFVMTPATQVTPQFSPDGHWMAYASDESGRNEVYIAAFPGGGGQVQVSAKGGTQPHWCKNGKELVFLAPDGKIMSAAIRLRDGAASAEQAIPLFETHNDQPDTIGAFDAVASGERFLVIERDFPTTITLLLNWKSLLKSK
jgi:Tol biopolymer transport system component